MGNNLNIINNAIINAIQILTIIDTKDNVKPIFAILKSEYCFLQILENINPKIEKIKLNVITDMIPKTKPNIPYIS